jgi:hypothetical protein
MKTNWLFAVYTNVLGGPGGQVWVFILRVKGMVSILETKETSFAVNPAATLLEGK